MTWTETNIEIQRLKSLFVALPSSGKLGSPEQILYEKLSKPIRDKCIEINYIRIKLCQEGKYE